MQVVDAIRHMVETSGKSGRQVSVEIGRSPTWMASTLGAVQSMRSDSITAIANACGYDLQLAKRDGTETIIIDPPASE